MKMKQTTSETNNNGTGYYMILKLKFVKLWWIKCLRADKWKLIEFVECAFKSPPKPTRYTRIDNVDDRMVQKEE